MLQNFYHASSGDFSALRMGIFTLSTFGDSNKASEGSVNAGSLTNCSTNQWSEGGHFNELLKTGIHECKGIFNEFLINNNEDAKLNAVNSTQKD